MCYLNFKYKFINLELIDYNLSIHVDILYVYIFIHNHMIYIYIYMHILIDLIVWALQSMKVLYIIILFYSYYFDIIETNIFIILHLKIILHLSTLLIKNSYIFEYF